MTDQPPQPGPQQPGPEQPGWQPGPQQPGWQQPGWQQPGWQQPGPQQPWPGWQPPAHPQAMTVLVLGILGIVLCQVLGPFAWVMGNRTVAEIDAAGGRVGGRTEATIGRVLGIVATCMLAAFAVFAVVWFVFTGAMVAAAFKS
jgi:hypothetical protein